MLHSIGNAYFGASHRSALSTNRTPGGRPGPFWGDVSVTPWSNTMRNHAVSAALVSGPGVLRMWRFYSKMYWDN